MSRFVEVLMRVMVIVNSLTACVISSSGNEQDGARHFQPAGGDGLGEGAL